MSLRSGKKYQAQETPSSQERKLNNSPTNVEERFEITDEYAEIESSFIGIDCSLTAADESGSIFLDFSVENLHIDENMAAFDRRDFKDIPEFKGDPSELPRFITLVSRMNESLLVAERVILFEKLGNKLTGTAFDLHATNTLRTWATLKNELEERFLTRKDPAVLVSELQAMYQGRSEPVRDYANRISNKLAKIKQATALRDITEATKTLFNEEHERISVIVFKNGLREPLRTIVKATRALTLQVAINTALEEEGDSNQNLFRSSTRNRQNFSPQDQSIKQEPDDRNPVARQNFKEERPPIFCNRCQRRNHMENQCYARFNAKTGEQLAPVNVEKVINAVGKTQIEDFENNCGRISKNWKSSGTEGQVLLSQTLNGPLQ